MKRLNWLKKFGLIASTAGAVVPVILTSTSCTSITPYVDVFDFKTVVYETKDPTQAGKTATHYATSNNNLLYGSKSNHNGNYILFVGSNTNTSIVNWFAPAEGRRDRDQWWGEEFWKTPFYKALVKVTTDEKIIKEGINDCGFYCAIDFFDRKFYDKKNHEIFISKDGEQETHNIKPFDKWSDGIINQTKIYNKNKEGHKYEWDETSVSKSEYIRQDDSAKAYRELVKRGKELFPKTDKRKETFDDADNNDTAKMVVFKDGKIVSIDNIPSGTSQSGIDTFVKIVVDNYKVAKDEEKK